MTSAVSFQWTASGVFSARCSENGLCYNARYVRSPEICFYNRKQQLRRSELDSEPI